MRKRTWLPAVVVIIALGSACGGDATTQAEAGSITPGITSDGLDCVDRAFAHGDPTPDFVGEETEESAVTAAGAGQVGASQEREDGRWLVRHDGRGVALLEVGEAPGGGFWVFNTEMCSDFADLLDSGALYVIDGTGYAIEGLGEDDRTIVLRCSEPQYLDFTPSAPGVASGPIDPLAALEATLTGSPPNWTSSYVKSLEVQILESEDPVYLVIREPEDPSVVAFAEVLEQSRDIWAVHVLRYCEP